jgi:hypothetical protein
MSGKCLLINFSFIRLESVEFLAAASAGLTGRKNLLYFFPPIPEMATFSTTSLLLDNTQAQC